jgi:predicted nucleic acid-binding protein
VPWLIDTDVAIHLRDGNPAVSEWIAGLDALPLLSIVSRVELENGVYREREYTAILRQRLDLLLEQLTELPFGADEIRAYSAIVAHVSYSRARTFDRMIAAQAIVAGATLITVNGADFKSIPGLALEVLPPPA